MTLEICGQCELTLMYRIPPARVMYAFLFSSLVLYPFSGNLCTESTDMALETAELTMSVELGLLGKEGLFIDLFN